MIELMKLLIFSNIFPEQRRLGKQEGPPYPITISDNKGEKKHLGSI